MFYKSIRIGRYGKPFTLYKFRTMVMGAEKMGSPSTADDDVRITRIGRFLRKYKIDELPQIINVLKGDIGFVGPRPTLPEVIATLDEETKRIILSVKPGITGWGSLWDHNEEERLKGSKDPHQTFLKEIYPEIIKRELWYMAHKSIWLDIKILCLTIKLLLLKLAGRS